MPRMIRYIAGHWGPQSPSQNSFYLIINYKKYTYKKIQQMFGLLLRPAFRMSLDFTNLAQPITTAGQKNYTIPTTNPIDGYITHNHQSKSNMHSVIMIHEWWGFNKSITTTAELFSNSNIRVFVPDFYRGQPAINAQEAGHKMNGLNWPKALEDIKSMKQHFEKTSQSVSVVGFCMGGALSFASAASIKGFKAAGVFYGIPDLNIFRLDRITANVIGHFGRLDPLKGFSDAQSAESLANDAANHNYPIKVRIWENVSHAFCNQDSKYFDEQTRNEAFKLTRQVIEA